MDWGESWQSMTAREREVATYLASSGLKQSEIADEMGIALGTLRKHSERVYRSLGVHSRAELMAAWQGHRSDPAYTNGK